LAESPGPVGGDAEAPARPETAHRHWFDVNFWPDRDPDGVAALRPVTGAAEAQPVDNSQRLWIGPGEQSFSRPQEV
jgi:hypothetical protein